MPAAERGLVLLLYRVGEHAAARGCGQRMRLVRTSRRTPLPAYARGRFSAQAIRVQSNLDPLWRMETGLVRYSFRDLLNFADLKVPADKLALPSAGQISSRLSKRSLCRDRS